MCNHYSSSGKWRDEVGEFSQMRLPVFHDRGRPNSVQEHVYPGRDGEILMALDGQLVNAAAHWRFVPFYWKGSLKEWARPSKPGAVRGKSCNNAKGETADATAMFREAAGRGRCLIPADAFFEFAREKGPDGRAVEHRFCDPDGRVLWLAGLSGWADPEEGRILSYTMVTKGPGAETASIGHHRQPVNLRRDQLAEWLDPATPVKAFLTPSPEGTFRVGLAKATAA
jgi:putative SOS response-associated peptidase YedK